LNKLLIMFFLLFLSFSTKADLFDFFKSKPVKAVPFQSASEIMKRMNSIIKTAEHCSRACMYYYSSGKHMRGGESACDDYYDWERNFFLCYKITNSSYKTNEVKYKLRYIQDLEEAD
jgi:hypothetical protein